MATWERRTGTDRVAGDALSGPGSESANSNARCSVVTSGRKGGRSASGRSHPEPRSYRGVCCTWTPPTGRPQPTAMSHPATGEDQGNVSSSKPHSHPSHQKRLNCSPTTWISLYCYYCGKILIHSPSSPLFLTEQLEALSSGLCDHHLHLQNSLHLANLKLYASNDAPWPSPPGLGTPIPLCLYELDDPKHFT